MNRLAYITEGDLDDEQREVWDSVTKGRRGASLDLINDEGGLIGPFNALLYGPKIGLRVSALGDALRFDSSLDRRLLELAVITVGAHWRANFEWWAHSRYAREAGVADDVIDAIAQGADPPIDRDDERTVYSFCRQLLNDSRVDDETYQAAVALLAERGVFELTALIGYYCLVSASLNVFRVSVPPGSEATWAD